MQNENANQEPSPICTIWKRGMSLIEVLAALALIAVVAVSVSAALVSASAWNVLAADQSRATAYATEIMEQVKASAENLPALSQETYSPVRGNWEELGLAVEGQREEMTAQVRIDDYDEALDLYRVEVEVSWETRGRLRRVDLMSVVWGRGFAQ